MSKVTEIIVPSSPADRQDIKSKIQEISGSMTRIEGEKDYIKETIADLSKKYNLPKNYLSRMAKVFHKSIYTEQVVEGENFQALYETITGETSL